MMRTNDDCAAGWSRPQTLFAPEDELHHVPANGDYGLGTRSVAREPSDMQQLNIDNRQTLRIVDYTST